MNTLLTSSYHYGNVLAICASCWIHRGYVYTSEWKGVLVSHYLGYIEHLFSLSISNLLSYTSVSACRTLCAESC